MVILPLVLMTLIAIGTFRFGQTGLIRLAHLPLRGGALAISGLVVQTLGFSLPTARWALLLLSTLLLLGFCWANRHHAGIALVALGIALNMAVMLANGAAMPLNPAALREMSGVDVPAHQMIEGSKDRVLPDEHARLPWLGDRLVLPGPLASLAVWSIGDVVLIVGIARLVWYLMKGTAYDSITYGTAKATP